MKTNTTLRSVSVPGYSLIFNNRRRCRGGGVDLFVKKEFRASLVDKSVQKDQSTQKGKTVTAELEYLLAKVNVNNRDILVIVFYRPPDASIENSIESLTDLVNDHSPDYSAVMLMGDLNLDSLKHNPKFKQFEYDLSCVNVIHLPFSFSRLDKRTGSCTLIDHIFISKSLAVSDSGSSAISVFDHDALFFAVNFSLFQKLFDHQQ